MAYLLKTTEVYRVETETAAVELVNAAKEDTHYTLTKYLVEDREKKVKGEVEDEWKRVTLIKVFNDEKEPYSNIEITYAPPTVTSPGEENPPTSNPDPETPTPPSSEGPDPEHPEEPEQGSGGEPGVAPNPEPGNEEELNPEEGE